MAFNGNRAITTDAYRQAVAEIIAALRREGGLSDRQLADRLGCSASTIRNARSEHSSLDPALLIRIEQQFGPGAIDPFLALANARALPLAQAQNAADPALPIVAAVHAILEMQARESEGGRRITRQELARILPELREGRAALDAMIARAAGD